MREAAHAGSVACIKLSGSLPELAAEDVLEGGLLAPSSEVPELSEVEQPSETSPIVLFPSAAARSAAATAASSCKSTSPHVRSSSM